MAFHSAVQKTSQSSRTVGSSPWESAPAQQRWRFCTVQGDLSRNGNGRSRPIGAPSTTERATTGERKHPRSFLEPKNPLFSGCRPKIHVFGLPPSLTPATLCWRTTRPNAPNRLMSLQQQKHGEFDGRIFDGKKKWREVQIGTNARKRYKMIQTRQTSAPKMRASRPPCDDCPSPMRTTRAHDGNPKRHGPPRARSPRLSPTSIARRRHPRAGPDGHGTSGTSCANQKSS